ncbi:MAG: hypothetical protein LW821_02490 [Flammeovirgaceae bacterium]|jgi:hypothetical protein|nr:hypothetical protein [Flammeovirgaceae bacterium]
MSALTDKIIRLIAFLVITHTICNGQDAFTYDFSKADRVLSEEFFKSKFWTMPTDENDVCYFQSKSEAKKTAKIIAIPVLKLKGRSETLSFELDYATYVALLFKQNSFLCPLYVNAYHDKQNHLRRYITVGWNPSSEFIKHYLQNSTGWFYLSSITDFVFVKSSRYYVWDDQRSILQDYTENLIAVTQEKDREIHSTKFTGIDSLGLERVKNYRISTTQSGLNTLRFFKSLEDTIQIGSVKETLNVKGGMNRIVAKAGTKSYIIELHSKKEWITITTEQHTPFATYVNAPYTTTSENELGFNRLQGYSKRLVEINVKKDLKRGMVEFILVKNQKALLTGQRVKREKDDYFIIRERIQNVVNPQILTLTAIVIFWSDAFVETQ